MTEKPKKVKKPKYKHVAPAPDDMRDPALPPSVFLPRIANLFQSIQRDRVGLERSLAERPDIHDPEVKRIYDMLVLAEDRVVGYLLSEVQRSPVWPWLRQVKGIGPRLGGMLIGLIDIAKAPTVSSLWKYAGLAVLELSEIPCPSVTRGKACVYRGKGPTPEIAVSEVERHMRTRHHVELTPEQRAHAIEHVATRGSADRRVRGQKLGYNSLLRKTCFLVVRQFIMAEAQPYEGLYRTYKAWYTEQRPTWPPGRCELAARRRVAKVFLAHLWEAWRRSTGLPTRALYVIEKLGHTSMIEPPVPYPPAANVQ